VDDEDLLAADCCEGSMCREGCSGEGAEYRTWYPTNAKPLTAVSRMTRGIMFERAPMVAVAVVCAGCGGSRVR
jgi:hypothetical protein